MESSCVICAEAVSQKTKLVSCPCHQTSSHGPVCNNCMGSYISIKISDAFMGTCPVITCPAIHETTRATILKFEDWSDPNHQRKTPLVEAALVMKYENLAKSLLTFLCSGCHKMNSLCVPYEINESERSAIAKSICAGDVFIGESVDTLMECLRGYTSGALTAEETYQALTSQIFATFSLADKECWSLFEKILRLISNPERRANLHLRYIRARPRCWTRCCSREHCFRCRSKDFHEGKTCEELVDTLDNNMLECPTCGIYLVKGDGCNSVTCVCGSQFAWSTELQVSNASRTFMASHPDNPSRACADALCEPDQTTEVIANANAWRTRHKMETDRELIKWWQRKFGSAAIQACALKKGVNIGHVPSKSMSFLHYTTIAKAKVKREEIEANIFSSLTVGGETAAALFETAHTAAVTAACVKNDLSVESLFTTMVPNPEERATAALKILCPRFLWTTKPTYAESVPVCPRLLASAHMWVSAHQKEYDAEVEDYESRMARCFLCMYGNKMVPTPELDLDKALSTPSKRYMANVLEWNRAASNTSLEFADAASVKRPGGVSCYPAAFATVPSSTSYFAVRIVECSLSQNTLSFGLAKRSMPKESSDGVGRSSNSWGIHDERGSGSDPVKASANGSKVASFTRKFALGDLLKCTVDLIHGICEISINDSEFVHEFRIPPGRPDDYYFAMTFANDHKVTLVDCATNGGCAAETVGIYNNEHSAMYHALIVRLRKIINGDNAVDTHRVQDLSDKYRPLKNCSREEACLEMLRLQPLVSWVTKVDLHNLEPKRREKTEEALRLLGARTVEPSPLSWQEFVYAVAYMTVHKQELRDMKDKAKKKAKKLSRMSKETGGSKDSGKKAAAGAGGAASGEKSKAVGTPGSSKRSDILEDRKVQRKRSNNRVPSAPPPSSASSTTGATAASPVPALQEPQSPTVSPSLLRATVSTHSKMLSPTPSSLTVPPRPRSANSNGSGIHKLRANRANATSTTSLSSMATSDSGASSPTTPSSVSTSTTTTPRFSVRSPSPPPAQPRTPLTRTSSPAVPSSSTATAAAGLRMERSRASVASVGGATNMSTTSSTATFNSTANRPAWRF